MKKYIYFLVLAASLSFTSCSTQQHVVELDKGQQITLTPKISMWIDRYNTMWRDGYQRILKREQEVLKQPRSIARWRKLDRIRSRKEYYKLFSNRFRSTIEHEMIKQGYSRQTRRYVIGNLKLT